MREEEEKLLQQRAEESKASFGITKLSILLPALIGSVLVGSLFYLSQRNLTQRQRAAEVLADQRDRLAGGNADGLAAEVAVRGDEKLQGAVEVGEIRHEVIAGGRERLAADQAQIPQLARGEHVCAAR